MAEVVDIFPAEIELTESLDDHVCPEQNCNSVFKKAPHLKMHLVKHHKIGKMNSTSKECKSRYFCPVEQCIYNIKTKRNKHFTHNRLLKQHYMKVHGEKRFECEKCKAKFSIQSIYKRHLNTCGLIFTCKVCGWEYIDKNALVLHLYRKHPKLHQLYKQNKYFLNHSPQMENSGSDNIKLPVLRNPDSSNSSKIIIHDTGQNKYLINKTHLNNPHNLAVQSIVDLKQFSNSQNVVDSHSINLPSTYTIGTLTKYVNRNEIYAVNTDESKMNNVNGAPSYVLIPTNTLLPNLLPSAISNDVSANVNSKSNKRPKKSASKLPSKSRKRIQKKKMSDSNCEIIKEISENGDESSISSFNRDRFTQTTLKIVKKTNHSITKKFNAETQTFSSNGTVKRKIKLDKSTNLSYENNKRTFATQTNYSMQEKISSADDLKVSKRMTNIFDKSIPSKSLCVTLPKKKILKYDIACSTAVDFEQEPDRVKRYSKNFNLSQFDTNDTKQENCLKMALQPCVNEIDSECGGINTSNITTNYSPNMDSQFTYGDGTGNSTTIETQTALDELLYSNRWKHDSILFSELICLSDIQTQTAWPTDTSNLDTEISFNENCLSTQIDSLKDPLSYGDSESALISTETQTNDNIFDFPGNISTFEETRNESPDFSFKETQTCDCFVEPLSFSDYDFGNLRSSFPSTKIHASTCCRVLLNRKSDVFLSCTSSETQTYLDDQLASKDLVNDSP